MIPKKIHYIWLGNGNKSKLSNACITTWRQVMPDYELIEWNESNIDLNKIASQNKFFRECSKRKLWSYMADYLRLKVLYEYGGIYFDTDVQVLKSFDVFLNRDIVIGYEINSSGAKNTDIIGTGVICAEAHNLFIKRCLDFYDEEIWNNKIYTIPEIMEHVRNTEFKELNVLSADVFSPYDYRYKFNAAAVKANTYSIHWFEGGWLTNKYVGLFLQTKHIKNPFKKKLLQLRYLLGYWKRKIIGS